MENIRKKIEAAWNDRTLLNDKSHQTAIRDLIEALDKGLVRVAQPEDDGWIVNDWVKKGVVMYFPIQKMTTHEVGIFEFHDKIPLKSGLAEQGVRVVPHGIAEIRFLP